MAETSRLYRRRRRDRFDKICSVMPHPDIRFNQVGRHIDGRCTMNGWVGTKCMMGLTVGNLVFGSPRISVMVYGLDVSADARRLGNRSRVGTAPRGQIDSCVWYPSQNNITIAMCANYELWLVRSCVGKHAVIVLKPPNGTIQ